QVLPIFCANQEIRCVECKTTRIFDVVEPQRLRASILAKGCNICRFVEKVRHRDYEFAIAWNQVKQRAFGRNCRLILRMRNLKWLPIANSCRPALRQTFAFDCRSLLNKRNESRADVFSDILCREPREQTRVEQIHLLCKK